MRLIVLTSIRKITIKYFLITVQIIVVKQTRKGLRQGTEQQKYILNSLINFAVLCSL